MFGQSSRKLAKIEEVNTTSLIMYSISWRNMQDFGIWILKVIVHYKLRVMDFPSRSLEDRIAETNMDFRSLVHEVSEGRNISNFTREPSLIVSRRT